MNLNPVEWTRAQELLLKLVKAVGPFANKPTVPSSPLEGAFSQTRQFFLAPPSSFRSEARLLTTLNEAKRAVDDWIGTLPETQAGPPSQAQRKGENVSAPNPPPNKGTEGDRGGAGQKTGTPRSAFSAAPETPPQPQVSSQAQKLVAQVQQAIVTLASSSYLNDPKAGP